MTMEWHEINDPAGRPHEEIGSEQDLEPIACQHEHRRINLSTCFLECLDCGDELLDLGPWVSQSLRVARNL